MSIYLFLVVMDAVIMFCTVHVHLDKCTYILHELLATSTSQLGELFTLSLHMRVHVGHCMSISFLLCGCMMDTDMFRMVQLLIWTSVHMYVHRLQTYFIQNWRAF